jgi:hypothetical protein
MRQNNIILFWKQQGSAISFLGTQIGTRHLYWIFAGPSFAVWLSPNSLAQRTHLYPNLPVFPATGEYDGEHPCLTAATTAEKVSELLVPQLC